VIILRYILFPVVPIYYFVTWLRNVLYESGVFKSESYNFPVICVGNLSVGGTGKTPMIEYLIRLLKNENKIATLSRGYKRSTEGFYLADSNADARTLGDEPFQFFNKFESVMVTVGEARAMAIPFILAEKPETDIILLDDAYQHRSVKPSFSILLSDYSRPFYNDFVLPAGRL